MIRLSLNSNRLVVQPEDTSLPTGLESQLQFWGLEFDGDKKSLISPQNVGNDIVIKIINYLERKNYKYTLHTSLEDILNQHNSANISLEGAREKGSLYKSAESIDHDLAKPFLSFLAQNIPRKLKDHQIKAALHLLFVGNGANFSVPGSGKTSVVLAVYQWLKFQGQIDALFIVGPPSCFGPWRHEFKEVIGDFPKYEILAGGDVDQRRSKYFVNRDSVVDLYLTSFQTLLSDSDKVHQMFLRQNIRFFLVIDEAHYIKKINGPWANSVLKISHDAEKICILTGTPFPQSYTDAFNLFDTLWPKAHPIPPSSKNLIQHHIKQRKPDQAMEILDEFIGPLFYRVRKSELNLAPQNFIDPILLTMNTYEKQIYDAIISKIHTLSHSDYCRNFETLHQLKRGRMIRMRQCLSYAALLKTAITDYSEDIIEGSSLSLADIIINYDELEKPKKLEVLVAMALDLLDSGEKVVIWSNFIDSIKRIYKEIKLHGKKARYIYGGTPIQTNSEKEELTREKIINEFTNPNSGIDILIANPAACAESISLHKTCSHAIYYDMSYNCSQFLQSLDRIHRVGGSENKPANYFFLQYENSLDQDILSNLQQKSDNMSRIIDQDYPIYDLNMFTEDEEINAYERLFGKQTK